VGVRRFSASPKQRRQRRERVGFLDRLVDAPAQHAREAHGDARLVARRALDRLEAELEDQRRRDAAHRAELLERRAPHDRVDLADLLVGEARVRLRERHELAALGPSSHTANV
jgi:hypothetical protein